MVSLILTCGLVLAPSGFGVAQDTEPEQAKASEEQAGAEKESKPKRPPIYDESANAEDQIAAALTKAKKENRRVLIQWGGNWCGWCHLLHEIMKSDGEIARKLMYEYDVVLVDIGKMDKNQDLLGKYEVDLKGNGVPFITVLDADGNVVVNQETASLEKDDMENPSHDREAVLKFLTKYEAEPLDAAAQLSAAIEQAAKENKLVFLHFGAPWCGWCHRLEAWLEKPDVQALLSPVFVDVKIDQDRMTGGKELLKKYCEKPGGIPWSVFIDPTTKDAIVTSDGPKGNVGFPFEDFEIAHFGEMLAQCERFSDEQIAAIKQSLVDTREAAQARPAQGAAQAVPATPTIPAQVIRQ
jgi:uncharacterized protein YyaL (SSP411 family)